MPRTAASAALALLLCAACFAAPALAAGKPFCKGATGGVPGGFSMLDSVPAEVVSAVFMDFVDSGAAANTTWAPCDAAEADISAAGCSQVVAGTNYQLQVNITCPGSSPDTVGLQARVFEPLPYTNEPLQVEELEVLFVDAPEEA